MREYRTQLNLNRSQVSKKTGISERTLGRIEDENKAPNTNNLIVLASFYKKSLKTLLKSLRVDLNGVPDDLPKEEISLFTCPYCGHRGPTNLISINLFMTGEIKRIRQCQSCQKHFQTIEVVEKI